MKNINGKVHKLNSGNGFKFDILSLLQDIIIMIGNFFKNSAKEEMDYSKLK